MSWQGYIDTSLIGSGHVDKAIIASAEGDSIWAASPDFHVQLQELHFISKVLAAVKDKSSNQSAFQDAFDEGVFVAGERCVVARIDERSIYARSGRHGVCIATSNRAIIITHHGETQVAGSAVSTTEKLANYLREVGY